MKKILAFGLAMIMIFVSFVACDSEKEIEDTQKQEEEQKSESISDFDTESETVKSESDEIVNSEIEATEKSNTESETVKIETVESENNETEKESSASFGESTAGLEFELNEDGKSYTLVGMGSCTASEIVIDGHQGLPVTAIGNVAFRNCENLTSVIIGESVTLIGNNAFVFCRNLKNAEFKNPQNWVYANYPDGIDGGEIYPKPLANKEMAAKYLVNSVGYGYVNYYWVRMDSNNNENKDKYVPKAESTPGLEFELNPDWEGYTLKGIGTCTASEIVIDGYNGLPVTDIYYAALEKCSFIEKVTIGNGVTSIHASAFYECSNLANITMPDNLKILGDQVLFGTALYKNNRNWENGILYVGEYLIEAKTFISGEYTVKDGTKLIASNAFGGCENLTSLIIPDSVIAFSRVFSDCDNLESITLGNGITEIDILCGNLSTLKLGKNVTKIAFSGNNLSKLSIYIDDVTLWCNIDFEYRPLHKGTKLYVKNSSGEYELLTDLVIPEGVTEINSNAFLNYIELKSVTIPSSVVSIEEPVFYNCDNLLNITVSENNPKYKSIDGNLYSKDGEVLIKYAQGKTDSNFIMPNSVSSIGNSAFLSCNNLCSITLSSELSFIGFNAFYGCSNLKNVEFKNTEGWQVIKWGIDKTETINISSADLINKETSVKYLTDTYVNVSWKREVE